MAGYYCQVTGVTFAAGRLQVSYEHRNGDLNTFSVVDNGIIGYDVSSLAGSTPAQKLASLKSQLDATLTQRNIASHRALSMGVETSPLSAALAEAMAEA